MRRRAVVLVLAMSIFAIVGGSSGVAEGTDDPGQVGPSVAFSATPNTGLAPGGTWTISNGPTVRHVAGTPVLTVTGTATTWASVCWGAAPATGADCNWEGVTDTGDGLQIGAVEPTGLSAQLKLWPFSCTQGSDIGGLFVHPGESVWIGWVDQTVLADPATKPLIQTQQLQYDCSGSGGGSTTFPVPGGTATLATSAGTIVTATQTSINEGHAQGNLAFPYGVIDFTVGGLTPGDTITVTVTLPGPVTSWYKYFPLAIPPGDIVFYPGATVTGNIVTLTLTDGGAGDQDGTPNGSITDPGLPAVLIAAPRFTG